MNGDKKWKKKCRMFADQGGRCHWCAKPMVMIRKHFKEAPENLATIEHLDSRLSGERGKHGGERRQVLACRSCNEARGREEHRKLSAAEMHKRSGRAPQSESIPVIHNGSAEVRELARILADYDANRSGPSLNYQPSINP